jgi:hypothetical protein
VGSSRRIDRSLAAKLLEESRACTSYFNRATVVARGLKILGSLAFSTVGELARGLYVTRAAVRIWAWAISSTRVRPSASPGTNYSS